MIPVRRARDDDAVEVAEDGLEGLGPLGRLRREGGAHVARLNLGADGEVAKRLEVARDPLDRESAVRSKAILHRR